MVRTFTSLLTRAVFSTPGRAPLVGDGIRPEVHAYLLTPATRAGRTFLAAHTPGLRLGLPSYARFTGWVRTFLPVASPGLRLGLPSYARYAGCADFGDD